MRLVAGRSIILLFAAAAAALAQKDTPAPNVVSAAALANDIAQTGHAVVYGIYFDAGKADLKPQSDPTLAEIGKLLTANAQLKLLVVGHTNNVGGLAANLVLSKQRADAVVAALVTRYHVAAARLRASGIGPLAPVATNRTEEGRAKNRRVELVEQ
jgi:outer membrane protein OmpA-like peptidoglycan-associated protein